MVGAQGQLQARCSGITLGGSRDHMRCWGSTHLYCLWGPFGFGSGLGPHSAASGTLPASASAQRGGGRGLACMVPRAPGPLMPSVVPARFPRKRQKRRHCLWLARLTAEDGIPGAWAPAQGLGSSRPAGLGGDREQSGANVPKGGNHFRSIVLYQKSSLGLLLFLKRGLSHGRDSCINHGCHLLFWLWPWLPEPGEV